MIEQTGVFTDRSFVKGGVARVFPVWKGSVRAEVNFTPLPKKQAVKLYHRARAWERQTRQPGRHGGVIGRVGLLVLHSLVFDFLNFRTGQLDPSYEGIAKKAGVSRASVGRALRRLKALGMLSWVRRCVAEIRDGRFTLAQERNAYAVQGEGGWQGYQPPMEAPQGPQTGTWGDHPPLLSGLSQAAQDQRAGLSSATVLATLRSDPGDALAAALARMGQAVLAREKLAQSGISG
jgi:alkylated DNA nucleotide flippase Atl1